MFLKRAQTAARVDRRGAREWLYPPPERLTRYEKMLCPIGASGKGWRRDCERHFPGIPSNAPAKGANPLEWRVI